MSDDPIKIKLQAEVGMKTEQIYQLGELAVESMTSTTNTTCFRVKMFTREMVTDDTDNGTAVYRLLHLGQIIHY